jgi:DNA replication protein DnaC
MPLDFEKDFFDRMVPKRYAQVTLESCDKQSQDFHAYAREWAIRPEPVLLIGSVGRGKTQFAFAMLREMLRKGHDMRKFWPRYVTSPALDAMLLESIKSQEDEKHLLNEFGKEIGVLFIDDFGRETHSDRAKRQYFEILNSRYAELLPTIISTNLTLDQISGHMGDAIASRFQEFPILEFEGIDLRIPKKIG